MQKPITRRIFLTDTLMTMAGMSLLGAATAATATPTAISTPTPGPVIRIGLIGTGMRGAGLATLLAQVPGAEITACCDIVPQRLEAGLKAAGPKAKGYSDYRKILDDKNIDAVIIATPHYLHAPMAAAAIKAGKHVYLEKSMGFAIPETLDLARQVLANDRIFQVGYQYRYYSLYHKVKEIIGQNWLGKVTHFESQYNRNSDWRVAVSDPKLERTLNWRMYRQYCGGPLSELCAHQIDMVNYLLGSHPIKATGMGGINYWKDGRDTYDHVNVIYEYPGGIKSMVFSNLSNAFNGYSIRVFGDRATVEIQRDRAYIYAESFDHLRGTVDGVTGATMEAAKEGPVELVFHKEGEAPPEPTITCLTDFIACIREKREPRSNAKTAMDSSIAILLGNAAMDTGVLQEWKPAYRL